MLVFPQPVANNNPHTNPVTQPGGFSGGSHYQEPAQSCSDNSEPNQSPSAPNARKYSKAENNRGYTEGASTDNARHSQTNNGNSEVLTQNVKLTKKQKKNLKKQIPNIIFNKSSIVLSKHMENLLHRGLNFAILPFKLDLTQVLVDFRYFERTMIWKEFWFGRDGENTLGPQIFKKKKSNLPKNYKTPNSLKTFLGAVKSELTDPENRNPAKCNLPPDEIKALKELINLQKEHEIFIKRCNKGSGIIVLDYNDYMSAARKHLGSNHELESGETIPFYSKVEPESIDNAKNKLKNILQEALDNNIISKEESEAMNPDGSSVGKFYMNFKVHKPHDKIPPERPIVSGCQSFTSNIGRFVEFHMKDSATKHPSYLQDTPDFIRRIESINCEGPLPENAMIATWDVTSLFTIIPQEEGVQATREALDKRTEQIVPTEFIIRLLEVVLSESIFEYSDEYYNQNVGTTMGSRPAPPFANNFMAKIDTKIWDISEKLKKEEKVTMSCLFRFLDDLLSIYLGSTRSLHRLWDEMNQIHPSVKFTLQHTTPDNEKPEDRCQCDVLKAVPFLDTSVSIKQGKIILDLYRKPTDRNKYLLPDSCHPHSNIENIPLSLAIRITRICSEIETRDQRYLELKDMLLERKYPVGIVDAAIAKARSIPRAVAIMRVERDNTQTSRRPVFVVSWDPRLPSVSSITQRHWRSMTNQDNLMKETFSEPPLIAYKRQRNIGDSLIRAKISSNILHQKKKLRGMKKCKKQCHPCPFIQERKSVKQGQYTWAINDHVDCESKNIIYLIQCNKDNCKENKYIGESEREIHERINEH